MLPHPLDLPMSSFPVSSRARRASPLLAALLLAASAPAAFAAEAIHHIVTYGQSIAVGTLSLPSLTSEQRHNSLMFVSGVTPQWGSGTAAQNRASLLPLVERDFWRSGETPVSGTLEMINDLRLAEDGVTAEESGIAYLGSAPGVGGQTIRALSFGSTYFEQLIWDVYYGNANARAQGKTYRVGALTWSQGESDEYWRKDPAQYIQDMESLRRQVEWVSSVVTGRQDTIPMISYQVSSHLGVGSNVPTIAMAQLKASQVNPNIHLATPTYFMDYVDEFHLSNASSKWLGAYYGLVYKRVVLDGQPWKPLQPLTAWASGRQLAIRFNVPRPPMVLDHQQVVDPGQSGFSLIEGDGNENRISGLAIAKSGDVLWIAAERPILAGTRLRYGWNGTARGGRLTGPRGNLRDSQGDAILFDPDGIAKPMHNWCVLFEIPVAMAGS